LDRQFADRVERDLQSVEQEIRSLRDRRTLYASELAQLSPHAAVVDEEGQTILGPNERRTLLERRYAQLSAVYSQDHPDVLKLRREIAALRSAGGAPRAGGSSLEAELAIYEEQLAAARNRYSADHPDVLRLSRTVESLRSALAQTSTAAGAYPSPPDNPQYVQRKIQLDATESEIQLALARRSELTARFTELERRAIAAPDVERDFNALSRGYEQLIAQYNDIEKKLREAEIAVNLESEGRGDRFTALESPQLPTSPERPDRLAVLLLAVIAALALGAGGVAIAERCDTTVRHPRDVTDNLGTPPIVAIPFIANRDDARHRIRRRALVTTAASLWLGAITFLIMTPA
jgi:chromosome segregation ATPase